MGMNPENHRGIDESYKRRRFDLFGVEFFIDDASEVFRQGIWAIFSTFERPRKVRAWKLT